MYPADVKVFKQLMHVNYLRGVHATGFLNVRNDNNDDLVFKRAYNPIDLFDMKKADSCLTVNGSLALLGHCRQATVGASGKHENAHPFTHGAVTMMHNGTLNSRTGLQGNTVDFPVDSEQVCYTLSQLTEDDEIKTMLEEINGAFALVWSDDRDGTINIARNSERTLFYAVSTTGKFYYASEKEFLELVLNRNSVTIEGEVESVPVGVWFQIPKDSEKNHEITRVEFTPRPKRVTTYTGTNGGRTTTNTTSSNVVHRSAKVPKVQEAVLEQMGIAVEGSAAFIPYATGSYPNTDKFVAVKGALIVEPYCDIILHGIPADAQLVKDAMDKDATTGYDAKVIGVNNVDNYNKADLATVELVAYNPNSLSKEQCDELMNENVIALPDKSEKDTPKK
jgi:hypothetical protein